MNIFNVLPVAEICGIIAEYFEPDDPISDQIYNIILAPKRINLKQEDSNLRTYRNLLLHSYNQCSAEIKHIPWGNERDDVKCILRWYDNGTMLDEDAHIIIATTIGSYTLDEQRRFVLVTGSYLLPYILEPSTELCFAAVKRFNDALIFIPQKHHTEDLYYMAARWFGTSIMYMQHQSRDVCLAALEQNPSALRFVREQTEEYCAFAVGEDPDTLRWAKVQTREMCLNAVYRIPDVLKWVLEQTDEICKAAVTRNGLLLQHVIEQTEEICLIAVENDSEAFHFCRTQTASICLTAVSAYWRHIRLVKEPTVEIVQAALVQRKRYGYCGVLDVIHKQTTDICIACVRYNHTELQSVLIQTPDTCMAAVLKCGIALQYVHEQTEENRLAAVTNFGLAMQYIPDDCKTSNICEAAVRQNGMSIKYVPGLKRTRTVCMLAAQQNGMSMKYVKYQTHAMAMVAVHQNGLSLQWIKAQSIPVCRAAVLNNPLALQFVHHQTPSICRATLLCTRYRKTLSVEAIRSMIRDPVVRSLLADEYHEFCCNQEKKLLVQA